MKTAIFGRLVFGRGVFGAGLQPVTPIHIAPADRTFTVPKGAQIWEGYKAPQERLNFSFDYTEEIEGDPIASSIWSLSSDDVTEYGRAVDSDGYISTIVIEDGFSGNIYSITNDVTLQSGLRLSATFRLFVNSYNV